jgi:hypothetical protein
MIKYLVMLCLLFLNNHSFSQIFGVSEKVDSIPLTDDNRKFILMVNKEYNKLIKKRADSILLYYPIDYSSNYAVIFWKKNSALQIIAFYQYNPPKQKMGKEILKNNILDKINIKHIYDILQDKQVRMMDTTSITSDDNLVFCQFYFNHEKKLLAGYEIKIERNLDIDFLNAYAAEEGRIVNREFKKSGVKRMSQ